MTRLIDILLNLDAKPIYPSVPLEEEAPDLRVARGAPEHTMDLGIEDISSRDLDLAKGKIRFFVDGVQRSVAVFEIPCQNSSPVNLIAAHVAVGATEPVGRKLRPAIVRQAIVIFLPIQAMIDMYRNQGASPPSELTQLLNLPKLDNSGDFYTKVSNPISKDIPYFVCDTSYTFQGRQHREGFDGIKAAGVVRRWARDMLREILRSLELGLVWELRQKYPDELILVDGPLAYMMFLMYGRLATNSLSWLYTDPRRTYDFLKYILGVVKVVEDIPQNLSVQPDPNQITVSIHKFTAQEKGYHMVSGYVYLRPELASSYPITASATSGLVRIDIPLPSIMDQYDPNWLSPDYTQFNRSKLREILIEVLALRTPIPSLKQSHRAFTELLPIYETENYLKSLLLSPGDLRFRVYSINV